MTNRTIPTLWPQCINMGIIQKQPKLWTYSPPALHFEPTVLFKLLVEAPAIVDPMMSDRGNWVSARSLYPPATSRIHPPIHPTRSLTIPARTCTRHRAPNERSNEPAENSGRRRPDAAGPFLRGLFASRPSEMSTSTNECADFYPCSLFWIVTMGYPSLQTPSKEWLTWLTWFCIH